ncbi:MAG: hypothetical protein EXQ56_07460 [Acidobacteria bacterium]|nr:hypothetical protein [Acidobacteriota bacterium]
MSSGNGNSGGITRLLRRFVGTPMPTLGCEIATAGVTLARWNDGAAQLNATAWRPLAPGALDPTPLRENLAQPEQLRAALAGCLDSLGLGGARSGGKDEGRGIDTALVIPDQAARLFVLDFDKLPRSTPEAIQLIRWKLKKSVPFDIDASAVSFTARRRPSGAAAGWQVISVVTPHTVIHQYEQLLESLGLTPSRVTLSSLAALALIPESDVGSTLLAKFNPPWFTTVIVQGGNLCLFRSGALGQTADPTTAEILEAIYPSFAYFQDNFGSTLERVFLCGLGDASSGVAEALADELRLNAQPLLSAADLPTASHWTSGNAERYAASLVGLVREQQFA